MTAFENYIQEKGYKLTHGSPKEFNTYTNCQRMWNKGKINIYVGLGNKSGQFGAKIMLWNLSEYAPNVNNCESKLKEIENA